MKFTLVLALSAAVTLVQGQTSVIDVVPVPDNTAPPPPDPATSDLTDRYCVAEDVECPGTNVEPVRFAPALRECLTYCNRNLKCTSVFFDEDKNCFVRDAHCTQAELKEGFGGFDLMRLKKGDTCPAGRQPWVAPTYNFSNRFCYYPNKSCPASNLYRNPQNLSPEQTCLKKCLNIQSCTGVNYYDGKCVPQDYQCSPARLENATGTAYYMRLTVGADCPKDDAKDPCNDTPTSAPCPANAVRDVLGKCQCVQGYVMVGNVCMKVYSSLVCQDFDGTITCDDAQIKIQSASYGRHDRTTCPYVDDSNIYCNAANSLTKLQAQCDGQPSCYLSASNDIFGDPCNDTYKYLDVKYICEPIFSRLLCEGYAAGIRCNLGGKLKILTASYGRHDRTTCPASDVNTANINCNAANALSKVKASCDGQNACTLLANNAVFGEPCEYTYKYLEVTYRCES